MRKIIGYVVISTVFLFLLFILQYYGIIWHNDLFAYRYLVKGLDVSSHQRIIDWKKVADTKKFSFVYVKATEGHDFFDDYFKRNWKEAKKYGFNVGAYHFFSIRSSGKTQAKYFTDFVPVESDSLPAVIDLEISLNQDQNKIRQELKTFSKIVEEKYKKRPILYVTYETYNRYIKDDFQDHKIWIRDVLFPPHSLHRDFTIWQYNFRGRVNGINTYVDMNALNGSLDDLK